MLREALAFPHARGGATRDILIGGVLVMLSPLLVPGLLVWGYLLRVMDAGARGHESPPHLTDWERLLTDGLRAVVVVFVWGLLPLVVVAGGTAVVASLVLPVGGQPTSPSLPVELVTVEQWAIVGAVAFVLLLLALVFWLHLPAALTAVGTQGRLMAGFNTEALWTVVNTRQYVVGVVLAALVAAVGSILATLLTPLLIGFAVQFYVQVVVAYIVGRAVGGAAVTAIRPA